MDLAVDYGKLNVAVYRTYARPLRVSPIPESAFRGRDNALLACHVDVDVYGKAFVAAYSEGDNRNVVATDTMKNFIHAMALEFDGATLEELAAFLGERFLARYAQMTAVRLRARELAFVPLARTGVLFRRAGEDAALAETALRRGPRGTELTEQRSGLVGLGLVRLEGNGFAGFVRDEFTTLPDTSDRPLYLRLDAWWRYARPEDARGDGRYVAAEQARDLVADVFDGTDSRSIQHLLHAMAARLLERFPQLAEVRLEGQNRTWETLRERERVKVHADPRPTYGRIGLTLRR